MNRVVVTVIALVLVLALVISSAMSITAFRGSESTQEQIQPLLLTAESFPVPPGSTVAFPDATNVDPPEVVKGWITPGTLDSACIAWREAYRQWLGQQTAQVTGEVTPGVSCTFSAARGIHQTSLVVAVYGKAQPQATLRVWV